MKLIKNTFFLVSVIVFLSLIYIAQFNVFQTDDYIYASETRDLGWLQNARKFYLNWGGRYFSYTLNTLIPAGNPNFYWLPKVFPVLYFSALIFGFWLNLKFYFKQTNKETIVNSSILFLFYTISLASISEHFFWLSGANIYFLPIILLVYFIYFFGKFQENKKWKPVIFIFIFFLMGSNEIIAIFLIQWILFLYFNGRNSERLQILLFSTVCFCLSFFAPGNFNRAPENIASVSIFLYKSLGVFIANSIYILIKLCFIVPIFTLLFSDVLKKISLNIKKDKILLFASFALPILLFSGIMKLAQERVLDTIILYLLVFLSLALSSFVKNLSKIFLLMGLVIFLPKIQLYPQKFIYFNVNYHLYNIVKEVSGKHLQLYEQEMNERHKFIKNSQKDEIELVRIKNKPLILYFDELGEKNNPNYINSQLEKFYKKNKIYVETD